MSDEDDFVDIGAQVPIKEVVTVDGSTPMWFQHEGGEATTGDMKYEVTSVVGSCDILIRHEDRTFMVKIEDVIGALHHKLTEDKDA